MKKQGTNNKTPLFGVFFCHESVSFGFGFHLNGFIDSGFCLYGSNDNV